MEDSNFITSDQEYRKRYLRKHFSKGILELLEKGIPKEMEEKNQKVYSKRISHDEAVDVLNHVISVIGDMPIDFSLK